MRRKIHSSFFVAKQNHLPTTRARIEPMYFYQNKNTSSNSRSYSDFVWQSYYNIKRRRFQPFLIHSTKKDIFPEQKFNRCRHKVLHRSNEQLLHHIINICICLSKRRIFLHCFHFFYCLNSFAVWNP